MSTNFFNPDINTIFCPANEPLQLTLDDSLNESLQNIYVEYSYPTQSVINNLDFNPYVHKSMATFFIFNGNYKDPVYKKIGSLNFILFLESIPFQSNFDMADSAHPLGAKMIGQLFHMADQGSVYYRDIYLDTIDIEENIRGKGYGTILMNWLLAIASYKCGKLFLSTPMSEEKSIEANNFYTKFLSSSYFDNISKHELGICFNS